MVGKQWMWKIQHPEGNREIDELHVPAGRLVKLVMTSQDVIHSFFLPEFRIKQDVVPGRYTTEWFKAERLGTYHLFCSEYCGTSHSGMVGRVVVMSPASNETGFHQGPARQHTRANRRPAISGAGLQRLSFRQFGGPRSAARGALQQTRAAHERGGGFGR